MKKPQRAVLYTHSDDEILNIIANIVIRKKLKPRFARMDFGIPLIQINKKKDVTGVKGDTVWINDID